MAGVAAVLALLIFTFVQPASLLRAAVDAALLAGAWWPRRWAVGANPMGYAA